MQASPTWDAPWRQPLVNNFEILTRQLWRSGIRDVFADGSFADEIDLDYSIFRHRAHVNCGELR
jgi:hypothetical protein